MAPSGAHYGEGAAAANGGLTLRDPVTGAQYVQIQLLQVRSPDMIFVSQDLMLLDHVTT